MAIPKRFSHLRPHIALFTGNAALGRRNVFLMMRYQGTQQLADIEKAVRTGLKRRGINCHTAKDRTYLSDLWSNICIYMLSCDFGVAVFEQIDNDDFNPNVSIEVGFMLAMGKPVLLLKEKRMQRLPSDICGQLYRSFDSYNIADSVTAELSAWLDDLRAQGRLP